MFTCVVEKWYLAGKMVHYTIWDDFSPFVQIDFVRKFSEMDL